MMAQPAYKKAQGNNALAYGYQTQAPQITNQIIRRPLTDVDLDMFSNFYHSYQNRLRVIAIISLVLFFTSTFILSDIIMDWSISLALYLIMFIIGFMALFMSFDALLVHKRISDTLKGGTLIEVHGPAYRNRTVRKVAAWTIGPVTMMSTPEISNMILEGTQVRLLCAPRMNMVLSINNVGLKHGVRMMYPPNLESLAIPIEQNESKVETKEEEISAIEDKY